MAPAQSKNMDAELQQALPEGFTVSNGQVVGADGLVMDNLLDFSDISWEEDEEIPKLIPRKYEYKYSFENSAQFLEEEKATMAAKAKVGGVEKSH